MAMVTIPVDLYSDAFKRKVLHAADVAIRCRSIRDDAELVRLSMDPHSCCGLMEVAKFSVPGCITLPVSDPLLLMVCFRCIYVDLVDLVRSWAPMFWEFLFLNCWISVFATEGRNPLKFEQPSNF